MRGLRCVDDNRGVSPLLRIMVEDIRARHQAAAIKLVLFPGDMISGIWPRDAPSVAECNGIMLGHWRETMKPLAEAGMAIRVTLGNHEAAVMDPGEPGTRCGGHNWPYRPRLENFEVVRRLVGEMMTGNRGPESDLGFTYSFDIGGCHFVLLAAYTMFQNNAFSNETLQWLEEDLRKAEGSGKKLFVASHPPAFPGGGHMWDCLSFYDPDYSCDNYSGIDRRKERDRFWNILKKHKVIAYFCGHEHNIQVQKVEGVWHVVSAGLTPKLYPLNGAPLDKRPNRILYNGKLQNPRASLNWPWNDGRRSYWGWCLVTVEGNRVRMEVFGSEKPPSSSKDLRLLKRFDLK